MPAGGELPEAASLLGVEGGDMDSLRSIHLTLQGHGGGSPHLASDGSLGESSTVDTEHGPVTYSVVGDASKPTILTYHDLGLNSITNYQSFMQYPEARALLSCFQLVCVNAPGQHEGADPLPQGYVYPTMEQLAATVENVRLQLGLRGFIGLGVGLGANVLARYSLTHPSHVDALLLVNTTVSRAGWMEWAYQKLNIRHLNAGDMTTATVDYLLWHHFGRVDECSRDLVSVYRHHFSTAVMASNLAPLIESYIARTDLNIIRELDPNKKKDSCMIRSPVLNMTSNFSAHIEDTVAFNARLDPTNSDHMKVQDCGLLLQEQPGKVVQAVKLFLQGLGYGVGSSRRASTAVAGPQARRIIEAAPEVVLSNINNISIIENPLV